MCVPEDVLSHRLMAPCLRSSTLFLSFWLRFWQWQGTFWCAGPSALTVTSRASPTSLWCRWLWRTSQWDSWPFHSLSPSARASAAIFMGASSLHASCWSSHRAPSSVCWPLPWIGTSPSRSHWGEWMVLLCLCSVECLQVQCFWTPLTFIVWGKNSYSNYLFFRFTEERSYRFGVTWIPLSMCLCLCECLHVYLIKCYVCRNIII